MMCGAQEVGGKKAGRTSSASLPDESVGCGCFPKYEPQLKLPSSCPNLFSYAQAFSLVSGKQLGCSKWLKLSRGKIKSHYQVMRPDYWVSHILAPKADAKEEFGMNFNNGSIVGTSDACLW